MSKEYAEDKIRQALKLNGDNITRTRQQIMGWTAEDFDLLKALTRPHLDGIIAYQVERVASGRAELEKRHPEARQTQEGEEFGMDLLRAVAAAGTPVFGMEGTGAHTKRSSASKQHIEAIHKMASSRHKPSAKKNPANKET